MATTDSERYLRLALLTFEGGKWISMHILVRELDRLPGSPNLAAFVSSKKSHLKQKKHLHEFTSSQYRLLYPADGTDTDVEDWDLHLLLKFILEFFTTTLNCQEVSDLREILRIRNEVICHTRQPSVGEVEFLASWNVLVECIYRLALGFDRDTALKASTIIGNFRSGPLSLQESIEKLAQLCRNDEHMEHVVAGLARIERGQNVVATRVVSIDTKLDDQQSKINDVLGIVKRIQSSLISAETRKIDIPNLQTQLCISGDREANVKTVEDFVLRTLKAAIDKADDPTDEEMIKCAMREIIEKIEEQDAVVVSAEKGSILINIKCNTLNGLQKLLTWLEAKDYKTCLKNLEAALERHFQSRMNVCLALSNDTVLKLSDWSAHCMSDIVNTKSGELPYKAKVNVGVKCQSTEAVSRVVEYLTRGDAANTLNTLSETLSNAVGGRIRVHATLDTGKLLTDLKKAETDLPMLETSPQLTTQTTTDDPGYTDIKTGNEENTSNTDPTVPTLEQHVSNISLNVNEKAETDPSILDTSPQSTTQMSLDEPGYRDIKTSDEENTSDTDQALPTLEQGVSNISLDVNKKAEIDPSIRETSPQLTTQTKTDEPGYTDIKTSDDENTSKIYQAFHTLEQDVSKLSLHANVAGLQLSRGRDRKKLALSHLENQAEYLVEQYECRVEQQEHQIENQRFLTEQQKYLDEQKGHQTVGTDLSAIKMSTQLATQKTTDESQITHFKCDNKDTIASADQAFLSMEGCFQKTPIEDTELYKIKGDEEKDKPKGYTRTVEPTLKLHKTPYRRAVRRKSEESSSSLSSQVPDHQQGKTELHLDGNEMSPTDMHEAVLANRGTLRALDISDVDLSILGGALVDLFDAENLSSIMIKLVRLSHKQIDTLTKCLSVTDKVSEVYIARLFCTSHDTCSASLDFTRHHRLRMIIMHDLPFKKIAFNSANLDACQLYDLKASADNSVLECLRDARNLKDFIWWNCSSAKVLADLLPRLDSLVNLSLKAIDFGSLIELRVSTRASQLRTIVLANICISVEGLECLVDSLPAHTVNVTLGRIKTRGRKKYILQKIRDSKVKVLVDETGDKKREIQKMVFNNN